MKSSSSVIHFSRLLDREKVNQVTLAVIAGLNACIYLVVFVRHGNLFALFTQPRLDGSFPYWGDPEVRWRYIFGFASLGALYFLGWKASRRSRGRNSWIIVIFGALASSTILLFFYPIDAADIFDNIIHGRILGVYRENPFTMAATGFRSDPFYAYTAWSRAPSAYGPAWEIGAAITARLSGDGIIPNVISFKLLVGLYYLGCLALIAVVLQRFDPRMALPGFLLFAWNPLVLYETFGNGHNDVAMVFWVLVATLAIMSRRYTISILALTVGALVKFIPLLFIPVALTITWRDLGESSKRHRFFLQIALGVMLLVVSAYAPFWQGLNTLSIARRANLFSTSLPAVFYQMLDSILGENQSAIFVSVTALCLTFAYAVVQSWRARFDLSWRSFPKAAFMIVLFYLLLTCLWFQQWYVIWLVGLAALMPGSWTAFLAVVFSFTVLSKQFIHGPYLLRQEHNYEQPWLEIYLMIGALWVPWLVGILIAVRNWILVGWRCLIRITQSVDYDKEFTQVENERNITVLE